jgi:LacI family transcriptional regulator
MSAEPKHREISRQLLSEIAVGKYGPGGRLPSESQLVQRFQVSRPTVGRALRDLQAEGLIERRAGSGSFVRQPTAAAAPAAPTRQLGLLIPDLGTVEVFALICGELASVVRSCEYTLLWGDSAYPSYDKEVDEKRAVELCEQFIERRVAGVFFAPFEFNHGKEAINRKILERFGNAGIPVVLVDRDIVPFPERTNHDLVAIDNIAAGCLLAEHLFKLGCRRLAFLTWRNAAPTVDARITGVRDALLRHNLELPRDWIQTGDAEDAKFVRSLIAGRRWDAVICANDLTAAQLMRTLEKSGVRVPFDVRVVGFDDVKYATLLSVPLTTIHQPSRDIAVTACRTMLDRIADPTLPARSVLLAPRLVVRESCGAYLPRNAE